MPQDMASIKPPPRRRMLLTRTRTGCSKCKERRVKCDETKPECKRCTVSNRRCPGYETPTPRKPKPFHITCYLPDPGPMQRILHSPLGDPEEQYALQSFYQWSSLFPKELMVPFQEERIIFEPCLKHAALALGMTHQFYRKGWLSNSQHVFAMRQYGKALNSLMLRTTASTSDNIAISLLSCFLFLAFEGLQGRCQAALSHLHSGLRLLQIARQMKASDDYLRRYEFPLRSLFVRALCQITQYGSPDKERFLRFGNASTIDDAGFATFEEAQKRLSNLLQKITHHRYFVGYDTREALLTDLVDVDSWVMSFNLLLSFGFTQVDICETFILGVMSSMLRAYLEQLYRVLRNLHEENPMGALNAHEIYLHTWQTTQGPPGHTEPACPIHHKLSFTNNIPVGPGGGHLPFSILYSLSAMFILSPDVSLRRRAEKILSEACTCKRDWKPPLVQLLETFVSPELLEHRDTHLLWKQDHREKIRPEHERLVSMLGDLSHLLKL